MWQPFGNVCASIGAISAASSNVAGWPAAAFFRCVAASVTMSTPRSVPTMEKRPSANAISRGQQDRLPLRIQTASPTCPTADRDCVGVALPDPNALPIDAQIRRGQLNIGRLVPLTGGLRAHIHIHESIVSEPYFSAFGRIAAGRFQIVRKAKATPLAHCRRRGPPAGKTDIIHALGRSIQHDPEIAAVVAFPHRG
jgi:hypothetical protein